MTTETGAPKAGTPQAGTSPARSPETGTAQTAPAQQHDHSGVKPGHGRRAAQKAHDRNAVRVVLPVVGTVDLPPTQELAYIGGVVVLATVGALEWPIAGLLAAGHLLSSNRRNKTLHDFGEALEEA